MDQLETRKIPFDLSYKLERFREVQDQYFNESGEPYSATGFGSPLCAEMLFLIDNLEAELKESLKISR